MATRTWSPSGPIAVPSSPEPCGGARAGGCISYRNACEPRFVEWDCPWTSFPNAPPFMDEDLSDNAFAYASVQVLKVGEREDGWHTDGGASLLHAGLTIFGSRQLLVKVKGEEGRISLA